MSNRRRGDLSREVQNSIFSLLSTDPEIIGLQGADKVFDIVPQGTEMPYTSIGEDSWEDGGDKSDDGRLGTINIHTFVNVRNYEDLKTIMARINELLHDRDDGLNIDNGQVVWMRFNRSYVITDPDPMVRHGILTFKLEVNQGRE